DRRDLHSFPTRRSSDLANNAERHVVRLFQRREISEESLGGHLRRRRREKSTLRGRSFQPLRHFVETELLPIHPLWIRPVFEYARSEEHTSELQSPCNLV